MINDIGNGIFEFVGGILQVRNAIQIYRDKEVKGVFWPAWLFFTAWGYWNLYYYPSLDQWLSFAGGVVIAVANTAWVSMAWYYTRGKRQ